MIFHKNCLLELSADDISYLKFLKIRKDVAKFLFLDFVSYLRHFFFGYGMHISGMLLVG